MDNKIKKATIKERQNRSVNKNNLKKGKELDCFNFLDYFHSWKEKKRYIVNKSNLVDIDLHVDNYDIIIDNIKTNPEIQRLVHKNIFENNNQNLINKIEKKDLFEYIKSLIFLESNILIYGIGSKLRLIYDFLVYFQNFNSSDEINSYDDKNYLLNSSKSYYHILVINCYDQDVKIVMVLEKILNLIVDIKNKDFQPVKTAFDNLKNIDLMIQAIQASQIRLMENNQKILVVLNSIDGPSFLGRSTQNYLSKIFNDSSNINLLATCDNLYFYYYWSLLVKDSYSFYFIKYNTFEDYTIEISDKFSVTGEKSIKSGIGFIEIFKSLTENQRNIIKVIAEYQIKNPNSNNNSCDYKGLTFKALGDILINKRILPNTLQLKLLLHEPIDHNLILERMSKDGKYTYKLNLNSDILNGIISGEYDN